MGSLARHAKVALITGGNGITGSAILEYLCQNSTEEEWSRIIVTSRSPFECSIKDPRIVFIPLDFTSSVGELVTQMREICCQTTHAYFSSYIHHDDFTQLSLLNRSLFENFLNALTEVAASLENVTLQTGGKYYCLHMMPVPTPAREGDPRRQAFQENFYYAQEDFLQERQLGQEWSYNVIRPQAIIGSTIKPNGMNQALTLALYFLVCKEQGVSAPMPTNQIFWNSVDENSYAPLIADLTIFVSTNPHCSNEAFNMVNGDTFCWRYFWPRLASYFGVEATENQVFSQPSPKQGATQLDFSLVEWSKDKESTWVQLCDKAGAPNAKPTFRYGTWGYQDWVFQRSWCALLSMSKARKYGWTGYKDTYDCLIETFEKFKEQGLIPSK